MKKPNCYEFTLEVASASEITDELLKKLYDAGLNDGTVVERDGRIFIDMDREAATLTDAVQSALRDLAASGTGLRVCDASPEEAKKAAGL